LVLGRHCPAFSGAFAALFGTRLTGLVVLVLLAFGRTLLAGFGTGRSDDRLKGAASCADLRTGSTNVSAVEAEFDTRLAIRLSLSEFAEAFVSTLQAHGLAFEAFLDAWVEVGRVGKGRAGHEHGGSNYQSGTEHRSSPVLE
jgi:hypothetical protein